MLGYNHRCCIIIVMLTVEVKKEQQHKGYQPVSLQ